MAKRQKLEPLLMISVRTLAGNSYDFDAELGWTSADLRYEIEKQLGIPEMQQRLINGTRVLIDDKVQLRTLFFPEKHVQLNLLVRSQEAAELLYTLMTLNWLLFPLRFSSW